MKHYTYLVTDGKLFYIGVRTAPKKKIPETDTDYLGSSKYPGYKPTKKHIIKKFKTRKEAIAHEIYLHKFFDVRNNPMYANQVNQTSTGFDAGSGQNHCCWGKKRPLEAIIKTAQANKGRKPTKETRRKISENHADVSGRKNPRFNSTIYYFIHTDGREIISVPFDFHTRFNLNRSKVSAIINGNRRSHKGWRCCCLLP